MMIKRIETVEVKSVPYIEDMEQDKIYLSESTWKATHLCPTGCGEEIYTPFVRGGYHYHTDEENNVSIHDELYCEKCHTRYILKNGYAIAHA